MRISARPRGDHPNARGEHDVAAWQWLSVVDTPPPGAG